MAMPRDFPDLPPVWALGAILAEWLAAWWLPLWRFASPVTTAVGVALFVGGLAVIVWSALWFRRKKTPIEPRETPKALIVEGPYRLNRNPIYTGMTLALFGAALWFGALSALIVAAVFPLVIARRFITGEEAGLHRTFGAEAEAYFRRTRRW